MIKVKRKLFDPEKQRVYTEIAVEIPTGDPDGGAVSAVLRESGGPLAIARRLAARFALPLDPKEFAEELAGQIQDAPLEVLRDEDREEEVGESYFRLHCWIGFVTTASGRVPPECRPWIFPLDEGRLAARLSEEAFRAFLRWAGIPESDRRAVLKYWRSQGWLRVNNPGHFRKRVKVTYPDGSPPSFMEFYEVLLSEDFEVDETVERLLGAPLGAAGPEAAAALAAV